MMGIGFWELVILGVLGLGCMGFILLIVFLAARKK